MRHPRLAARRWPRSPRAPGRPHVAPARVTPSTASRIARHCSNCACCRGVGSWPDDPGAAEVGVEAAVADADVGPQHVALGQLPLGGQQRQRQVAGAWSTRPRPSCRASPARSDRACWRWRRARMPGARTSPTGRSGARRVRALLDVGHRLLGDPQARRMQAISSGVLTSLAAPITWAASAGAPPGTADRPRGASRRSTSSTATAAPAGIRLGQHAREVLDALVEFEVHRTVQVIGGQVRLVGRALPERQEQVRPLVVGEHDGHRPLEVRQPASSSGQLAPVAYTTLVLPSRISASTPWSRMAARSRAPVSRRIRARSGSSGMSTAHARSRRTWS